MNKLEAKAIDLRDRASALEHETGVVGRAFVDSMG